MGFIILLSAWGIVWTWSKIHLL